MNYYPKGGRCNACEKRAGRRTECSKLPFSTMPVYRRDGSDTTVICSQFVKAKREGQ